MSASDEIDELRQFLLPDAPAVAKGPAVCYLLGLTVTDDGLSVYRKKIDLINALTNLIRRDSNSTIVSKAYECVLNLSSHEDLALAILNESSDFIEQRLIPDALDVESKGPNVMRACALLANLTQTKESSEKVWSLLERSADDLLNVFSRRSTKADPTDPASADAAATASDDSLRDHLAFVFANLTSLASVRAWFTDPAQGRLEKLLPFISMASTTATRKHGAVGTIRNCTFDTAHHEWLLGQLNILPRLLCPLIGPEVDENLDEDEMEKLPIDCQYLGTEKRIEESAEVRKMLLESMTQLCATRFGRKYMKNNGAYYVLRELHKVNVLSRRYPSFWGEFLDQLLK